jgi:hypothetical protein
MGRCTLLNLNAKIFVTMDARGASPRETAVLPMKTPPSQSVILCSVHSLHLDVNICGHVSCVICGRATKSTTGELNLS